MRVNAKQHYLLGDHPSLCPGQVLRSTIKIANHVLHSETVPLDSRGIILRFLIPGSRVISLENLPSQSYIQYLRAQIGHSKTFLAFASIVLRDSIGRILLQRRADFHAWGLPGGSLELGEDIQSCARRELLEETGLHAGPLRLVGLYSEPEYDTLYPNGDEVQQFTVCFEAQVAGGEMRVDGVESTEQAFFAPLELPRESILPWYNAMLDDCLAGGTPAFRPPNQRTPYARQIESIRERIGNAAYIGVGSAGLVQRADGRLLVARRRDNGLWHFPGGYLDFGENAAQGLVRELCEETGLEVIPQRLLGIFSPPEIWVYPNGDRVQSVVALFACCPTGGSLRIDGTETLDLAWLTADEALTMDTHPLLKPVYRAALDCLQGGWFVLP